MVCIILAIVLISSLFVYAVYELFTAPAVIRETSVQHAARVLAEQHAHAGWIANKRFDWRD